jgi:hypothetical protein
MDLVNITPAHPPDVSTLPPNPGIAPADLYHLSDHDARVYPRELLAGVWCLYTADQYSADPSSSAAAMSVWTSRVYNHYHVGCRDVIAPSPVTGVPAFVQMEYTFTCRHDPEHCRMRTRKREATGSYGTKNLKEAVRRCNERRGVPDDSTTIPAPEYSDARFRALLVMWCAASRQPFYALRDPVFLDIVSLLRPGTSVPSPQTTSRDVTHIYNQISLSVRDRFQVMISYLYRYDGNNLILLQDIDTAMHLAVDGWTSPLSASFLGIVVFWYEGAKIWSSILEFIQYVTHTISICCCN